MFQSTFFVERQRYLIAPFMRLGLWNSGPSETSTTPFTSFQDFMEVVSPGKESQAVAMGRMEVVARELSTEGMYVSRSLAFNDTEFTNVFVDIPNSVRASYDRATVFWTRLVKFLETTIDMAKKHDPDDEGQVEPKVISTRLSAIVWGAHQRFFKSMMLSTKMPYLIQRAKDLYEGNERYSNGENKGELTGEEYAPVIALWSTAESAIQNAAAREDGGDADLLEELVSAPREGLRKLLRHFDFENSKWLIGSHWSAQSENQVVPAMEDEEKHMEEWNALMDEIDDMDLPGNPLDLMIHELGGKENVAEMSGRSVRQVKKENGDWKLESRTKGYDGVRSTSDINNNERQAFMDGKKNMR